MFSSVRKNACQFVGAILLASDSSNVFSCLNLVLNFQYSFLYVSRAISIFWALFLLVYFYIQVSQFLGNNFGITDTSFVYTRRQERIFLDFQATLLVTQQTLASVNTIWERLVLNISSCRRLGRTELLQPICDPINLGFNLHRCNVKAPYIFAWVP